MRARARVDRDRSRSGAFVLRGRLRLGSRFRGCGERALEDEVRRLRAAEVLDAAGVPAGVFNLVNGDGPTVGAAIASHPDVDMVSFTGSTRAGIEVARAAAPGPAAETAA